MKQITLQALLGLFDSSVHDALRRITQLPGTTHLVVYENRMIGSPHCGERTALAVGPQRSLPSLSEAASHWLHDLPSTRQYAVAYVDLALETAA